MKAQTEYQLEGAFKVDIYNRAGDLVETTDYFSNFITATGLYYPLTYAFADCFRFLSIGSGAVNNRNEKHATPTSGLYNPILSFNTETGAQSGQYIGYPAYVSGDEQQKGGCGTTVNKTGPIFYRAWYLPSGDEFMGNSYTSGDFTGLFINEFMVSPSSGSDPSGKYAFSRVVRPVWIKKDTKAVITYELKMRLANTGITPFNSGTFTTGNADVEDDADIISQWARQSGYYRQVYHGLRCVDVAGATFTMQYGDLMEPKHRETSKGFFYLSPDNSQFDASPSGGYQTNIISAYGADGLYGLSHGHNLDGLAYLDYDRDTYLETNPKVLDTMPLEGPKLLSNIRLRKDEAAPSFLPLLTNYKNITNPGTDYTKFAQRDIDFYSLATPGASGLSSNDTDFGQKSCFSTYTVRYPFESGLYTGRTKRITRKMFMTPSNSLGRNTRYGALVYAYRYGNPGNYTYYPMLDALFFDSSGRSLMQHYRRITGVCFEERGTGLLQAFMYPEPYMSGCFDLRTINGPYGNPLEHFRTTVKDNDYLNPTNPYDINVDAPNVLGKICSECSSVGTGSYGQTGKLTLGTAIFEDGWGSAYGFYGNTCFDYGLVDHSLTATGVPSPSGQIYWPYVPPHGEPIVPMFSGLVYYHPDIGLVKDYDQYFGTSQVVRKLRLTPESETVTGSGHSLTFFNNDPTTALSGQSGYFITTKKYSSDFGELASLPDLSTAISSAANLLTGYLLHEADYAGKLHGGSWKAAGPFPPVNSAKFGVKAGQSTIVINGSTITGYRVTGFFDSMLERGSGIVNNTSKLNFAVSGQDYFLTYVANTGVTTSANNFEAWSYLSGDVAKTDFRAPSGKFIHTEAYALLPHYAYPNSQFEGYAIANGGTYPAMSFDNGLNLYLDITWSSSYGTSDPQ